MPFCESSHLTTMALPFVLATIAGILSRFELRFDISMKTQGEIEAAICDGISRFERDYMG
jgi:hypothetical protein